MKSDTDRRVVELAQYIVRYKATVRAAAEVFGISKSTVHNDVSNRLRYMNMTLYMRVKWVIDHNMQYRHIRGGQATREKHKACP